MSNPPLDAVRALAPRIRELADETEAGRRLPLPLVKELVEAGAFRLCVPRSLGGLEADVGTMVATIEAAAEADGAVGWCVMIGATSGRVSAYLPESAARLIYGDPKLVTGGVFAP